MEERLLVFLNLASLDSSDEFEIQRCLNSPFRWDTLLELAEINAVIPLTLRRFRELNIEPPSSERFSNLLKKEAFLRDHASRRVEKTRQFLDAFHQEGIETLLLKGGLLAPEIYRDPGYKKM